MENKAAILQDIVRNTYNTEHRISCDGYEWKIYIVLTRTTYRGTLEEVLELAIEEFTSYRKDSNMGTHIKHYKKYSYRP